MMKDKLISIFLIFVLLVGLSIAPSYGDLTIGEMDRIRFNREIFGGVVGGIIGSLIMGSLVINNVGEPQNSGNLWNDFGASMDYSYTIAALLYFTITFIGIPWGSAIGVTAAGRSFGYKSDWWKTLEGSYDGVGISLGFTPITLITCPIKTAKIYDKYAKPTYLLKLE